MYLLSLYDDNKYDDLLWDSMGSMDPTEFFSKLFSILVQLAEYPNINNIRK